MIIQILDPEKYSSQEICEMFWQYANYTTGVFYKATLDTFQCKAWIFYNMSSLRFTNLDTDTETYLNAYRNTEKGNYQKYLNREIKVYEQLDLNI